MNNGKQQAFPYSLRTVAADQFNAVGNAIGLCNSRYFLQITPPTNALTIENLYTHIVLQFDASVATANQTLVNVGVTDSIPFGVTDTPNYERLITYNKQADANRRIDISVDLTSLLKKSIPGCYIEFNINSFFINNTGTIGQIEVWKADGLYTTTGIR